MSETSLTIGGAGSYVFLPKDLHVKGLYEGKDVFGGAAEMIPELTFGPYLELFGKIGQLSPTSAHGLAAGLIWNGNSRYNRFIWDAGWKYLVHHKAFMEPYVEIMMTGSHLLVDGWDDPYHQMGISLNVGCHFYVSSDWALTFFLKDQIPLISKFGKNDLEFNPRLNIHAGLGVTWSFGKDNVVVKSHLNRPDKHLLKRVKSNIKMVAILKDPDWIDRRAKLITSQFPEMPFAVLSAIENGFDWFFSNDRGQIKSSVETGVPSIYQYFSAVFSLSHSTFDKYASVSSAEAFEVEQKAYQLLGDIFETFLVRLQKEVNAASAEAETVRSILNGGNADTGMIEEAFSTFEKRMKYLHKLIGLANKVDDRLRQAPYFYEGKPMVKHWDLLIEWMEEKMGTIPMKELRSLMKGAETE